MSCTKLHSSVGSRNSGSIEIHIRPEGAFSKNSGDQNSRSDLLGGAFLGDVPFILGLLGAYDWTHVLRSLPDLPD